MSLEEEEEPGGSFPRQVFPDGAWVDVGWAQPLGLAPRTELPLGVRAPRGACAWIHIPGTSCVPVCLWHCCGKSTLSNKSRNPGMAGDRRQVPHPGWGQETGATSWPEPGLPVLASQYFWGWGEADSTLIHELWGEFPGGALLL